MAEADPRRALTNFVNGDGGIDPHLTQEWLVTNGMGGYASGTVLGPLTRRYHGLLIAALSDPPGRFMMLHGLSERFRMPEMGVMFAGPKDFAGVTAETTLTPVEFSLECGMPVWRFDIWGRRFEKRILLPYKQNTVHIQYRYLEGSGTVRLGLRPGMHFRLHSAEVNTPVAAEYVLKAASLRLEIAGESALPVLRLKTWPQTGFTYDPKNVPIDYLFEAHRGYPSRGDLSSPVTTAPTCCRDRPSS